MFIEVLCAQIGIGNFVASSIFFSRMSFGSTSWVHVAARRAIEGARSRQDGNEPRFQGTSSCLARLVRACMYACVRAYMVCVHSCVHACNRVSMRACKHACVRACMRICAMRAHVCLDERGQGEGLGYSHGNGVRSPKEAPEYALWKTRV